MVSRRIPHTPSVYSTEQIRQYLARIRFPAALDGDAEAPLPPPTMETLHMLNLLHRISFNYETSVMHYSAEHVLDITPEGIFRRLVAEKKGGSFCYGLNILFMEVIRGLGYRTTYVGAEHEVPKFLVVAVSDTPHMCLLVQLPDDEKDTHLLDLGFGGLGLIRPILMNEDEDNVVTGTTPTELHRLRRISPPPHRSRSTSQWWRLEVTHTDQQPSSWDSVLVFSETEHPMSSFVRSSDLQCTMLNGVRFWWEIIAIKYFLVSPTTLAEIPISPSSTSIDPMHLDPAKAVYGRYTLSGNVVRRAIGRGGEVLKTLTTERERIEVLREVFDVKLRDEDERFIEGRAARLDSGYTPVYLTGLEFPAV